MINTMPEAEILVGLAALGLTVTGFSGLISVLGRRSAGHWTDAERFQLSQLIELSLAVTFASFIPILVSLAQENPLPTATAMVALFHLVILIRGITKNYRRGVSVSGLPGSLLGILILGGFALILAGLLSSVGFIAGAAFFLVANLLWQLLVATVHFVALLMSSGGDDRP